MKATLLPLWPGKPHGGEVGVWLRNRLPNADLRDFLWPVLGLVLGEQERRTFPALVRRLHQPLPVCPSGPWEG